MNSKAADRIATGVFVAIAITIVTILAGLFFYIFVNGFKHISLEFLTSPSSNVGLAEGFATNYLIHFIFCLSRC